MLPGSPALNMKTETQLLMTIASSLSAIAHISPLGFPRCYNLLHHRPDLKFEFPPIPWTASIIIDTSLWLLATCSISILPPSAGAILDPLIVRLQPFGFETGFLLVTLISLWFCGTVIYYLTRAAGFSEYTPSLASFSFSQWVWLSNRMFSTSGCPTHWVTCSHSQPSTPSTRSTIFCSCSCSASAYWQKKA